MKRKKIIIPVIIVLIIVCQFVPLHKTISHNEYINKKDFSNSNDTTRYFLKYAVGATGVNWYVDDCSDKSMIGECVMIRTFIDPRFLDMNKNFELDLKGTLIVEESKKVKTIFEKQYVWRIYPKRIYIYMPNSSNISHNYYFRDVSFWGYIKLIVGIFYWPWRYSY